MVEEEEYWGWLELIEVEKRSILLHNLWILSSHSGNYMINNFQLVSFFSFLDVFGSLLF